MRLPHHQLKSIGFLFETSSDLIQALGSDLDSDDQREIERLFDLGLPPVLSNNALAVMFGYNPGFIWSLLNRTKRYYRVFEIPKGIRTRTIYAPRVGLKAIQKWLSYHWQDLWSPNDNTFGFVPGRSHIDAAQKHLSAKWVYSLDIENFFPSVSSQKVKEALKTLGYSTDQSINILSNLCCLNGNLVQGSPASPILSNIVLKSLDDQLTKFSNENGITFTRYADDLVFSGNTSVADDILPHLRTLIENDGWRISERKVEFSKLPQRLKVHGLLVHGEKVRLTKGYRNKLRAYQYLANNGKICSEDFERIKGHLNYASCIERKTKS
jgi:RNA-directed DNA polymerase